MFNVRAGWSLKHPTKSCWKLKNIIDTCEDLQIIHVHKSVRKYLRNIYMHNVETMHMHTAWHFTVKRHQTPNWFIYFWKWYRSSWNVPFFTMLAENERHFVKVILQLKTGSTINLVFETCKIVNVIMEHEICWWNRYMFTLVWNNENICLHLYATFLYIRILHPLPQALDLSPLHGSIHSFLGLLLCRFR